MARTKTAYATEVATIQAMGVDRLVRGRPTDPYFRNLIAHGAANPGLVEQVCLLQPGDVFLDVGANIGITSMIAAAAHARIVAIEGSPSTADLLEENLRTNAVTASVLRCAVGARSGVAHFDESDHSEDHNAIVAVPLRTIDNIVAEIGLDRLDLIKIDAEGHELDVLAGARETLRRFRPKVVMRFNAFLLTAMLNQSPRAVLDAVLELAGSFTVDTAAGLRVHDFDTKAHFIFEHMIRGCVNDLIFRPKEEAA